MIGLGPRRLPLATLLVLSLSLAACTPLEKVAYNTVIAANAFTKKMLTLHPECSAGATSALCVNLRKAQSAKDALIDAVEVYCANPAFDAGGVCTPPAKGTPTAQQAADKLRAAIAAWNQTAADVKGAVQ